MHQCQLQRPVAVLSPERTALELKVALVIEVLHAGVPVAPATLARAEATRVWRAAFNGSPVNAIDFAPSPGEASAYVLLG